MIHIHKYMYISPFMYRYARTHVYRRTRYPFARATLRSITGKLTLMKLVKLMWWPILFAMPATTIFADAPTSDPLPPRQAPKHRAKASGLISRPSPAFESCWMTGTIVAV